MECKVEGTGYANEAGERFNRDIVECKESTTETMGSLFARFNRDIVECKGACSGVVSTDRIPI